MESRRGFLDRVARAALGVTALGGAGDAFAVGATKGRAKSIILVFAQGGMSQLDSFDPKPGREEQGPAGVIRTKVPGVVFGESFPRLADTCDKLAVIRSMTTATADHAKGQYLMRTAYPAIASIRHPSLGAWVLHALGGEPRNLPGFIGIQIPGDHPGCGFLDATHAPMPVPDPAGGIQNMKRSTDVSPEEFNLRLRLAHRFDQKFKRRYRDRQIDAFDTFYRESVRLMASEDVKAFDLEQEPLSVRESYGLFPDGKLTPGGQGCLLARRLVEAGVPFIEVEIGNWDGHYEWFNRLSATAGEFDRAVATLLDELASRGLLESTLVVVTTEFGRTPAINERGGREHHPAAFTSLLAGAGVKAGVVYGATDEIGFAPDTDPVSVADFNTTIAAAAGLPYDKEFFAPNGRPFKIGGGGTPIREVLA